jgi:hypothetical protein
MQTPKSLRKGMSVICAAIFLSACGLSPQEVEATATQIAEAVFLTETASAPTLTPTPLPTDAPTVTPVPSATQIPTDTPTSHPTMTKIPTATRVLATATTSMSQVKIVNNLNANVKMTLTGPTNKSFTINAHSTFEFEVLPGDYSYTFAAVNFVPQTGWITFPPGKFTWTWGKSRQ